MDPTRYIWKDGALVEWDDATVHVLAHGLHYGTGVFEGIRAYQTERGTAVFRLGEHMDRMARSCKALGIPIPWSPENLAKAAKELLAANELRPCYIRPIVFYDTGSIGLNPAGASVTTFIAAWEWGPYMGKEGVEKGITAKVSSWRRITHESLMPNAKVTGGYVNSILAKQEALRDGYDEAIMLNAQGFVAEGSGMNIFIVRDGRVITPPVTAGVLEGVTRDTVMTVLGDEGNPVTEAQVARTDLYYADEVFITGTAAEITPVRAVDGQPVGAGEPGPITRHVQERFREVVTGKDDRYDHWLEYV